MRSFLDDFESDFDVCNVNNHTVDSDHGDPVIVHLRCLCDFSLLRYEEDDPTAACLFRHFVDRITVRTLFGLFNLEYFINMHYSHIASDKGVSICERVCYLSLFEC